MYLAPACVFWLLIGVGLLEFRTMVAEGAFGCFFFWVLYTSALALVELYAELNTPLVESRPWCGGLWPGAPLHKLSGTPLEVGPARELRGVECTFGGWESKSVLRGTQMRCCTVQRQGWRHCTSTAAAAAAAAALDRC